MIEPRLPSRLKTLRAIVSAAVIAGAVAACGGGGGGGDSSADPGSEPDAPALFTVEPSTSTIIGVGQTINVYAALKSNASDPYPAYIDPDQVTWASSNPGSAAIDRSGTVTGTREGTTTITARYQTHSSQLNIQVSGSYEVRSVSVAGQGMRSYAIYTPPFGADVSPHPAIISIHGGGGTAAIQAATSTLNKFAHSRKIYVAYLEGTGVIQTFNGGACCGRAQTSNIDDVVYVGKVLDDIELNYNVNAARVYATGFSNGGIMSHRLACAMSDRLAAVAAVSGGSGEWDNAGTRYYTCNPARRIPVLHIHATNDRNYPYLGGPGDGLSSTNYYSVDSTIADWLVRNNLIAQATTENVTPTTTCHRYSTVADTSKTSALVTLCKVHPIDIYDAMNQVVFGGGHSWPGGVRSPAAKSDVPLTDFDANAYIWNFWNQ